MNFAWKLVLQMSFLLELSQSTNDWLFIISYSGDFSKTQKFNVFSLAQASVMIMHMARHFRLWKAIKSTFVCTLLPHCLSTVMHSLVWPEFIVWRSICRVKSTYFWKRNFNVQSSISPYLSDGFFWFLQRRCENSIIYHIFTLVQAIVFTTGFDSFFSAIRLQLAFVPTF